jgi:hypothetical protein
LLVIPLLTFFLLFSSACAIQQSVTVLSEGSYGKTPTEANAINSKAGMMGALVAIPFLLVGGFLFDLMGRFKTVALLFFIMGVSIILIPLVSPSVGAYYVCRTVMQCAVSPLLVNPFVNDYVVVK